MAQLFKNFEAQTLNTIPTGFTSRWAAPSAGTEVVASDVGFDAAIGGQVFRIEGVGGGFTYERVGFEITEIAGSSSDRMAALINGLSTDTNELPLLMLRGGGSSGATRTGYILYIRAGSGNFGIRRANSGAETTEASGTLPSSVTAVGATANVEFSAIDDGAGNVDVAATIWEVGESKPASPQLTYQDTSPLSLGWAGVGNASADDVVRYFNIGYVGIGTKGDSAPTAPVPTGPTLDTIPATAFPGETITLGVTGAEAVQGTGGVTINGVAQTVDSWSDTSIEITVVQGDTPYGTGNTVTLTTDGGDTDTGTIELVANTAGGFGSVDMVSPNTTDESSVAFGATPTVVNGDQFEWEDFNTLGNLAIDAEGFVTSVDTEGTFRGRFWDATDSTWGAVETFTAEVPGEPVAPSSRGLKRALKVQSMKRSLRKDL